MIIFSWNAAFFFCSNSKLMSFSSIKICKIYIVVKYFSFLMYTEYSCYNSVPFFPLKPEKMWQDDLIRCLIFILKLYIIHVCYNVNICRRSRNLSVQFICSLWLTLYNPMDCSTPGLPVHHQLPEFHQIHVHWFSDANQPSHLLSSPSPPALKLSQLQGLSHGSVIRIKWPKYWSFSFSISPSNEYSGLNSFRMQWLDLLAVEGTPKSLLQHHSSNASILRCSVFSVVQLSYMPLIHTWLLEKP